MQVRIMMSKGKCSPQAKKLFDKLVKDKKAKTRRTKI
jgi:hypothetical protein